MRPIRRSAGLEWMVEGWCGEVEGRAQGRNTRPVVAGVSRKIVNTDWLEVDEGDLPVLYTADGVEKMDWAICFQSSVIFLQK